jgi:hypothetical protein
MARVIQDKIPTDILDYPFRWKKWLDGDIINTYTITVETIGGDPSPLILDSDSKDADNITITVWLSAGTIGNEYLIECQIVTAGGRTKSKFFIVRIVETD